jgi:hypothetical protein
VAQFTCTVQPQQPGQIITNSTSFAPRALGDQTFNFIDNIGVGVFRANLFNTPYASGYIYITNVFICQLASTQTAANWQFEDSNHDPVWQFEAGAGDGPIFELQGCNIKLPATSTWQLRCTASTNTCILSHGMAWTYSQF